MPHAWLIVGSPAHEFICRNCGLRIVQSWHALSEEQLQYWVTFDGMTWERTEAKDPRYGGPFQTAVCQAAT